MTVDVRSMDIKFEHYKMIVIPNQKIKAYQPLLDAAPAALLSVVKTHK